MVHLLYALLATARSCLRPQRELALENLALSQQLAILKRKTKRPKKLLESRNHFVVMQSGSFCSSLARAAFFCTEVIRSDSE